MKKGSDGVWRSAPSSWPPAQHQAPGDWQIMAERVDRHLPYSTMSFHPTTWAFNLGWHERPKKEIHSYPEPAGYLRRVGASLFR
nr:hypothetical protein [uncultured Sphingomonas sp.]